VGFLQRLDGGRYLPRARVDRSGGAGPAGAGAEAAAAEGGEPGAEAVEAAEALDPATVIAAAVAVDAAARATDPR
jgi:hypothetical protein